MISTIARLFAHLARPLRHFNTRLPALERIMDCELTEPEVSALAGACRNMGNGFSAFYAWKVEQMALISTLRSLNKAQVLSLVCQKDCTNYAPIETILTDPRGLLIALPHHGHFVLSIIALCEHLRHRRDVFVFYDPPEVHATNEIFDALHACLFGVDGARVEILHNSRAGIVRAMKELRSGQIVMIMPDVYKRVDDTYQVQLCGNQRNVMLGSATIARRTNARILPVVSRVGAAQFSFVSAFGNLFNPYAGSDTLTSDTHADFRTTTYLFAQLEVLMKDQLLYWQYVRSHAASEQPGSAPALTPDMIRTAGPMLLNDPRVIVNVSSSVDLDIRI